VNALPLIIYGAVVLALLFAEFREDRRAQYLFKPLAALGFILLAIYFGALETKYGQIILAGLVACALGDVFLLSRKSESFFKAGIAAFAVGHLIYTWAFIHKTGDEMSAAMIVASFMILGIATFFFIWLKPKLPRGLKAPVLLYVMIIVWMVHGSLRMDMGQLLILAPIAAIMFAASDMFVARDRFVKPDPKNALAITPLYFGAQALYALSTQISGVQV
jgi:uncharacterized membrane protein YhhN